jgi:hypothetical protein
VVAGWPDLNTLSVRLVITTAILFGFLTAVFAEVLTQGRIDQRSKKMISIGAGISVRPGSKPHHRY